MNKMGAHNFSNSALEWCGAWIASFRGCSSAGIIFLIPQNSDFPIFFDADLYLMFMLCGGIPFGLAGAAVI
jgi:hypothetical protein